MELVRIVIVASTLLCSLVAGFVFAFAIVVMPGIKVLNDHDYLQVFKVMDRVIQNNQPIFIFVWLGSAVAVIILAILGIWHLDGMNRALAIIASIFYLLGVQLPTATINIPLNNQLQARNIDVMNDADLREVRTHFESRWSLWNSIRTVFAIITTMLLIFLALRL